MRANAAVAAVAGLVLALSCGGRTGARTEPGVEAYDPAIDGIQQLEQAGERAASAGTRVLVIVGGNWCVWCRALDSLVQRDDELRTRLEEAFVVVHLNHSKENRNEPALERLGRPESNGFPVLVVLSPALEVLHTQETGSLETGDKEKPGHDRAKLLAFIEQWRA